MSIDSRRHEALFTKEHFDLPVHIIGTGGVGSHVAYELAKLGVGTHPACTIHFYDGDTIEPHNIANQAFDVSDIEMHKVDALAEHFFRWSGGIRAHTQNTYVHDTLEIHGVVFLCLDSMQARRQIARSSLWNNKRVQLVIDPRMDADNAVVFAIDPNNEDHVEYWEDRWFPDENATNQAGCGGHISIITTVAVTASIAVRQMIAFAKQRDHKGIDQYRRLTLGTWETSTKRL